MTSILDNSDVLNLNGLLTEDEQWRKLELIVAVARDVWG